MGWDAVPLHSGGGGSAGFESEGRIEITILWLYIHTFTPESVEDYHRECVLVYG